ncbi:MAG: hypothetical protein ABI716_00450 [Candidatus Saccharibacteria bacterium]
MTKTILFLALILTLVISAVPTVSHASPYGKGVYGANVPYGSQTALSIATSGNVSIPITPTSGGVLATGTSTVTVTSTDVTGYKLYVRALTSTNMNNLGALLPASVNGSPATLAMNSWGYNTDASSNFVGLTLADSLIRSVTGPVSGGDSTAVTYGIQLDLSKPAGNYLASVIYTAVPQTN